MGYIPGPVFSEILRAVEDAQLEGQIVTKEEAKELVRKKFALKRAKA
jgi:poly(A) polymerase